MLPESDPPPLIINAALTGMVPRKSDNPHVPITPREIIADARRCRDAGAVILHLHAREADGAASFRSEVYAEIFTGVRQACPEVLISASCSGRVHREFWQRSQVLDLSPDMASLTLGSLNFAREASINTPQMIRQLAAAMRARGIMPELEIFDLGMAEFANRLVQEELLQPPFYANLLFGSLGTMGASAENLCAVVRALPRDTIWSAAGIGRYQYSMNSLAVVLGGHVRVGLEDALYYDWRTKTHATNAGLIERVTKLAAAAGRTIATAAQTRLLLGKSFADVTETPVAGPPSQRRAA